MIHNPLIERYLFSMYNRLTIKKQIVALWGAFKKAEMAEVQTL